MADDALRPSLLDRLRQRPSGSRRAASMSGADLRQSVLRDLGQLLNTTALSDALDLSAYPHVERSVLNYGLSELAGATPGPEYLEFLRNELKRAISTFEPRIEPKSLRVELDEEAQSEIHGVAFEIRGEIRADPMPIGLAVRTEFNLESGICRLRDSDREG